MRIDNSGEKQILQAISKNMVPTILCVVFDALVCVDPATGSDLSLLRDTVPEYLIKEG